MENLAENLPLLLTFAVTSLVMGVITTVVTLVAAAVFTLIWSGHTIWVEGPVVRLRAGFREQQHRQIGFKPSSKR